MTSFLILDIAFYSLRVIYPLSYVTVILLAKGFLDPFWIDRTGIYHNFFHYFFVLCFSSYSDFEATWDMIFAFICAT